MTLIGALAARMHGGLLALVALLSAVPAIAINRGAVLRLRGGEDRSPSRKLVVRAGPFTFDAKFEWDAAPKTVEAFQRAMPFEQKAVHVRWSGEAVWLPLGEMRFTDADGANIEYENHSSFPAPGQVIVYPGGISECEILVAYGGVSFASKVGQLAGNHFITLTSGLENLPELGRLCLYEGAQPVKVEWVDAAA